MDVDRARRPLLFGLALLGVVCLAFAVGAATGFWKEHPSPANWVYLAPLFGAAVLCLARAAMVRAHRGAWVAIGIGLLFNGLGDLYWLLFLQDLESVPYPSAADALWLAVYPPMGIGLWLLLARQGKPLDSGKSVWVDGLAAALAGTALAAATLLAAPLEAAIEGHFLVFATNLAYPLADLLLLGVVLVLCGRAAWHPGIVGGVLAGSLLVRALTDFVTLSSDVSFLTAEKYWSSASRSNARSGTRKPFSDSSASASRSSSLTGQTGAPVAKRSRNSVTSGETRSCASLRVFIRNTSFRSGSGTRTLKMEGCIRLNQCRLSNRQAYDLLREAATAIP